MPNIIDSLFIELGVDVSKFSADQARALKKIAEFEEKAKKSGKGAGDAIKTVGDAFRDLAKETRVGASAAGIDQIAKKLTALGKSAQVAGVLGGGVAEGLGMLLSPAALGAAAVGLLGKEMWDLNKVMTANDALMARQAQLSSMNADSLYAWGEAARLVGANPQDITGGISGVQTAIAGMMIGAGNATPQLVALSRLGLGWNAESGLSDAQVTRMFTKVHQMAAAKGYKNLGGLRALTGPIMNDSMFALATSPKFDPATMQSQIKAMEPANLNAIFQDSLKSQMALGKLDIDQDILKETAYGSEQGLMMSVVEILRSLLGYVTSIARWLTGNGTGGIKDVLTGSDDATIDNILGTSLPKSAADRMALGKKTLMALGMSEGDAAAMIGNAMQESSMDPVAFGPGNHRGLFQLDRARQAAFAKRFGYEIGSFAVSPYQQSMDQLKFQAEEPSHRSALAAMSKALSIMDKTRAFMRFDEVVNDGSLARRFVYASQVMGGARSVVMTNETHIGSINVHTPSTDPAAHADAVRKGVATHPLVSPIAQGTVSLATRGMSG